MGTERAAKGMRMVAAPRAVATRAEELQEPMMVVVCKAAPRVVATRAEELQEPVMVVACKADKTALEKAVASEAGKLGMAKVVVEEVEGLDMGTAAALKVVRAAVAGVGWG